VVQSPHGPIAVFRTVEDQVFALLDRCPHRGSPLSKGVISGQTVECPSHGWIIGLNDGNALPPDQGCARSFPIKVEEGAVFLQIGA